MKTIYIVFGTTGEYSDRREWLVKAFTDENKAKELVIKATERSKEIFVKSQGKYWRSKEYKNEFDPNIDMDYTGTEYYYWETELDES